MTHRPTLPARTAHARRLTTQPGSHAALTCTGESAGAAIARSGRLDAVIVPSTRGAATLDGAAHLAAASGATLVVLCSRRTRADAAVERVARVAGCRVVAADVPAGYRHELMPVRSVASRFRDACAGRVSDLSVKRNVGLLLARLHGWGKILFLDDDIVSVVDDRPIGLPEGTVRRLADALDRHQIAGLTCRDFPDNSVFCHARRLAGFEQDTFVSGGALGVNCNDHPLPLFPDQYNEDWFFFSRRVAARDIAHVGDAVQAAYDPFEHPDRARQEEFGDLVAEGLFSLFESQPAEMEYRRRLAGADTRYWERVMADRRDWFELTSLELGIRLEEPGCATDRLNAALRSLDAGAEQLSGLTPELCADFVTAWADDLVEWERATERVRAVATTSEALDVLGLRTWCGVEELSPVTWT